MIIMSRFLWHISYKFNSRKVTLYKFAEWINATKNMEQRHRPFAHFHPLQGYSNLKYNIQVIPNFAQKIPIIDI